MCHKIIDLDCVQDSRTNWLKYNQIFLKMTKISPRHLNMKFDNCGDGYVESKFWDKETPAFYSSDLSPMADIFTSKRILSDCAFNVAISRDFWHFLFHELIWAPNKQVKKFSVSVSRRYSNFDVCYTNQNSNISLKTNF